VGQKVHVHVNKGKNVLQL